MLHKDYDGKGSVAKKNNTMVVFLKRLGAKTNPQSLSNFDFLTQNVMLLRVK
jgi:hypothetical protein